MHSRDALTRTLMSISIADRIPLPSRPEVSSWAVKLGRFGLAARGVVYAMVGILAARVAFGYGGKLTDKQGAVHAMEQLPFGSIVLWAVALGLLGYVAWRFAQAFMDLDGKGSDRKGLMKRAAALCSGLAYLGLSTGALASAAGKPGLALGGGTGGDAAARDWTAWLLSQPFGRWLVGIVGLVIAGVAIRQLYQGITCKFTKHLRGGGLTATQEKWSRRAGRVGYTARGVAFALIAWFIISAALHSNPQEAGGLTAAFRALSQQDYGRWLLAAVGIGFALFGVYSLIEARYRRIGR